MTIQTKICGLSTPETLAQAVAQGADMIGFVFFPRSPRAVTAKEAAVLSAQVPSHVKKVGLFVDADDETIAGILETVKLDMLQLHGSESPERTQSVRDTFKLPVIKAIKVETADDIDSAQAFEGSVDWLLFDAKAPKSMVNALPGGNAISFDWTLLQGRSWSVPWMLSGGLNPDNVEEAIRETSAMAVDVSSGVESAPGIKDIDRIKTFLDAARAKT